MLYTILMTTFSSAISQDIWCNTYQECYGASLSGDTITCGGFDSCNGAEIAGNVLDCSYSWSCYNSAADVLDSVSCGDYNSCYQADISVSVADCSNSGIIYCSSSSGASCQQATLTSDSVVCDGSVQACGGSIVTTNSLTCGLEGACEYTTVLFSGDSAYSSIIASAFQAARFGTFTQKDGDISGSNTLDIFLNEGYSAENSNFYSGDYNYMNVYYNDLYSGYNSNFYCQAYSICTFYCDNYYKCLSSVVYIDETASYTFIGAHGPNVIYFSSPDTIEESKSNAKRKTKKYNSKLSSKMKKPLYNPHLNTNNALTGQNIKDVQQKYNEQLQKNNEFLTQIKIKMAKNSRKSVHFSGDINIYYIAIICAFVILIVGIIFGMVLYAWCCTSNKAKNHTIRQPNLQYI